MNLSQNLDQLAGITWGESTYSSSLVKTCHALRLKPLAEFTAEDCRIMIGQSISLPYLVPLALRLLEEDPFASGDYYVGDLLSALVYLPPEFWQQKPAMLESLKQVARAVEQAFESGELPPHVDADIDGRELLGLVEKINQL